MIDVYCAFFNDKCINERLCEDNNKKNVSEEKQSVFIYGNILRVTWVVSTYVNEDTQGIYTLTFTISR